MLVNGISVAQLSQGLAKQLTATNHLANTTSYNYPNSTSSEPAAQPAQATVSGLTTGKH